MRYAKLVTAKGAVVFKLFPEEAPHMDVAYTVFGNLETGSEVLSRLEEGDAIEDLSISRSRP